MIVEKSYESQTSKKLLKNDITVDELDCDKNASPRLTR